MQQSSYEVSIIIPVYNAELWLEDCFNSILNQTFPFNKLQVSIYNDLSTDNSWDIILSYKNIFLNNGIDVIIGNNNGKYGRSCGWAKNQAIKQCSGSFLCFLDADDIMMNNRIEIQYNYALLFNEPILIGSNFIRIPSNATPRFTEWHNTINNNNILLQQYKEITIIHPTWFMHRNVWEIVGGYNENYPNCPEDMIFFYKWIELGGKIQKLSNILIKYRWHETATSFSIHRNILLKTKVLHFEIMVLNYIKEFTIWNVGRDGKKFFMTLSKSNKDKVIAFCDISYKKIGSFYIDLQSNRKIPIIHYSKAKPLVIICIALQRTYNNSTLCEFEKNLLSMNWKEGYDYWHLI